MIELLHSGEKIRQLLNDPDLQGEDLVVTGGRRTEAVAVLVQLGERRADAMALVERVLAVAPDSDSPETIIQHAYRLKAGAG